MTDQALDHPRRVQQLFDAKAGDWSAKYAPNGRLAGRLTQLVNETRRQTRPGDQVLDLGCGTGELARELASRNLRVTACDISANMLAWAAASGPAGSVRWIQLDRCWQALPFTPASFEVITAASVLEYVSAPGTVLSECARVLRPGGVLVCTVPDLRHPVRWLEWGAGLLATLPPVHGLGNHWPRFGRYLTYLRISRQRRTTAWWQATAVAAGLQPLTGPVQRTRPAPLRLYVFRRPAQPGEIR
jgi:2-polyprenyl-3-methyl-5-hydroxy-6-metoxy-1,4-benzoquinol methylase